MNIKRRWWGLSVLAFLFLDVQVVLAGDGVATLSDFETVIGKILEAALPLLGLAVGIMVIVGGFQLLTSGGNKEGAQKAKGTFTYAIFGLILAILAWFILVFIGEFTGVDVTQFAIPTPMP